MFGEKCYPELSYIQIFSLVLSSFFAKINAKIAAVDVPFMLGLNIFT